MKKILVLLAVVFVASSISVMAQNQRIAYVESDVIFKQLPEGQEASKMLQELGTKWQDTLLMMKKQLDEKVKQLDGPISEEGKAKVRAEAEQLQQVAMAFQNAKFGNDGELAKRQQEIIAPIKDKVMKAIEELAKEEKLGYVFDKAGAYGMFYADDKNDLTFKVLDRLKRGSK